MKFKSQKTYYTTYQDQHIQNKTRQKHRHIDRNYRITMKMSD